MPRRFAGASRRDRGLALKLIDVFLPFFRQLNQDVELGGAFQLGALDFITQMKAVARLFVKRQAAAVYGLHDPAAFGSHTGWRLQQD